MDKKRYISNKIDSLLKMFPVVAVLGARQCGKSTLVKQVRSDWKYYDLEKADDFQLIAGDTLGFFSRVTEKVIIDEAQFYPELFSTLRTVIDKDRTAKNRFLLTGSSSPLLIKNLSESLAGRIASVELSPFKAGEFFDNPLSNIYSLIAENKDEELIDLKPKLDQKNIYEQWFYGGYPEPRISKIKGFYSLWQDEYIKNYIYKDIQRLFPRLNTQNFRLFIQTLSFQAGTIINKENISRSLEVSSVTVKEYLDIIHDTFIWRNLRSYEKNSLKKVQKMPKGFFRDCGILHHLLKLQNIDSLLLHPVAGASFESFVIEEIIRGFQCLLEANVDFYFYRTINKSEIDLIVDAPFGTIPVEIKLGHKISSNMLVGLKNFIKDTGSKFGILVNNSERIEMLSDNIIKIPATYL